LSSLPEENGTFAIGDDEDDDTDDDHHPTPAHYTPTDHPSRASSVSSNVEDAVPVQLRGLSEKARGKMPAGTPTFSRQNSTTSLGGYPSGNIGTSGSFEPSAEWIETWLPELPLHTILTLIQQLLPLLPRGIASSHAVPTSILQKLQQVQIRGIEQSPIRIHSFEWSPLSLGWYESLLWAFVFSNEMQVAKGTVGAWNGTAIKLFRVQETAPEGPSLTSPRGAVDAVGSNIVSRIGNINLRGGSLASTPSVQRETGGEGARP
jgi:High-temperature-induced dauer-formation protein